MGRMNPDQWGLDRRQQCPVCGEMGWRCGGKQHPYWKHYRRGPRTYDPEIDFTPTKICKVGAPPAGELAEEDAP